GEDGIRDFHVTGVQTCALPIYLVNSSLLDRVGQTYRDSVNRIVADVLAGLRSPQQAIRVAVRQLAHKGLIALVDSRGRNWTLERSEERRVGRAGGWRRS